jgi:glycosyltransferase involved in cell wall biosynthesis
MVRGLASVPGASVEVVALHRVGRDAVDPALPGVQTHAVPTGPEAGAREWLRTWSKGPAPRRVLGPDWSGVRRWLVEDRRRVDRGEAEPFDLVWCSHLDAWWPLRELFAATPTIVDFDNLENLALRLRRRMPPRFPPSADAATKAKVLTRWGTSRLFDLVDERRWDRLQRECAQAVARVAVCSELDRARSGCPNAVVVGNGADAVPDAVVDRSRLQGEEPTLSFVGALDYEPNTDAVEWFVREVFALVRRRVPTARVRVVGRGAERLQWIDQVDGVDLVGPVDELEPELRRTDVSIVPIRVGAGTRLKVVEALANHLPLVTTTVGCEGIDLTHGLDALIVDDAEAFADACVRLLSEGPMRQRLADAGAELFAARYDWRIIEAGVAALASEVAAGRAPA